MTGNVFVELAVSLMLGLLVGLQRERTESSVAGIRTFPLIAMFGTVCAWLAAEHGGWVLAAGLVAVAALFAVGNLIRSKGGDTDAGQTTEIAAVLLYGVGAYVVVGEMAVAVALGGAIALLLHYKAPLHAFVAGIEEGDVKAIMQFALVTLVILPVLPNRVFGPYEVLNPFNIWLMVVLIVGISLAGYVAYTVFGARAGAVLGGTLGGLVSSTATTVSYARRSADSPTTAGLAALVIMIAAATVFLRVLVEIAAVARQRFVDIAPPLVAMLVACLLIGLLAWRRTRGADPQLPHRGNPADMKLALVFGGLYALILLAVAAAKEEFGAAGLYTVAVLSGLADMDAITLSTARLADQGRLDTDTGWRIILVASMSNLVFKAGLVAAFGSRELLREILLLFGGALLAGGAILWLWPVGGQAGSVLG